MSFSKIPAISLALLLSLPALAGQNWAGNPRLSHDERGNRWQEDVDPSTGFGVNIADYDDRKFNFDYYEEGVTGPASGGRAWLKLDAKAEIIEDATQKVWREGAVPIVGRDGNNEVYEIDLMQFHPDASGELPPALRNRGSMRTHLNVTINGQPVMSVPVTFQYLP